MYSALNRLSATIATEREEIQRWHILFEIISRSKEKLYDYHLGKIEDISTISPLIDKAIDEAKEIEKITTDEEELARIDYLLKEIKVFKQAVFAYISEVQEGYRGGTSAKEMERVAIDTANVLGQLTWETLRDIREAMARKNKAVVKMIHIFQKIVTFLLIIAIFLTIMVAFLMGKALSRPINKLVEATKRVAKGDLDYWIKVESRDDIGELTNSFNVMTDKLKRSQRELLAAKDYTDNIITSMLDMLIVITPEGKIKTVGKITCDVLEYSEEELVGEDITLIAPEEEIFIKKDKMRELITQSSLTSHEATYKTKRGKLIPVLLSLALMKDKDGKIEGIILVAKDITRRKKTEKSLQRLNRALRMLSECNQTLIRAEEETQFLEDICRIIVEIGGYEGVWVGFMEDNKEKAIRPVAQVGFSKEDLEKLKISWADIPEGQGPAGKAIRTQRIQIMRSPNRTIYLNVFLGEKAAQEGYSGSISLPLVSGDKSFGVLNIYSKELDVFSDEEVELLEELATDVSYGVVTLRMRRERQQTQKALNETKQMLENINQAITDGIYLMDRDFRILWVNRQILQQTGYKWEELIGNYCYKVTHHRDTPCEAPLDVCPVEEIIKTGNPHTVVHTHFNKEGKKFYVEVTAYPVKNEKGEIIQFVHVSKDITQRLKAEEDLKKLSSVVEQTTDSVVITDKEGVIEYVNPAFEEVTGYKKEEAIGKTPNILKSGKQGKEFYEHLWKTILSGRVFNGEFINKKKNGEYYYVEKTIVPIKDKEGNITHFVSTDRDITQRKEIEKTQRLE
jgi:PAS domain S-box-containing protein